jgi:hypothetical protein
VLNRASRVFAVAAVVLGGALLLGACGTSPHVVSGATSSLRGTSSTTTSQTSVGPGTSVSPGSTSPGSTSPGSTSPGSTSPGSTSPGSTGSTGQAPTSPVNQQTLSAFEAQLGALGQSLSQAVSGVDNTQGDS